MNGPDPSTQHAYQYVVLRCVPRVDREEFVNVGVVLYAQGVPLLQCATHVDEARLAALWPALDPGAVRDALDRVDAVCRGDRSVGLVAEQPAGVRFGFLKAPRSTVVQPGPVHGGLAQDPGGELARLAGTLLR
ncbi:DUF3037 domain-containing protein [Nocardioidaceae bacterium]|nr:DUF3037 domain-containing protein [Nocardioidaceae bacterium]